MNKDVKAQWVAALRSGKYGQARETLRDGNSFCCLGVLCDLSEGGRWQGIDDLVYSDPTGRNGIKYLTADVVEWSGIGSREPRVPIDCRDNADELDVGLDNLNDSGFTFAQIADVIEHFL